MTAARNLTDEDVERLAEAIARRIRPRAARAPKPIAPGAVSDERREEIRASVLNRRGKRIAGSRR